MNPFQKSVAMLATAVVLASRNALAGIPADLRFAETIFVKSPALSAASSLAWAPDGSQRLFVTRVGGEVMIVKAGALLPEPFAMFSPIAFGVAGGGGLLGMCFDPNFTSNHFVYFFVTVSATEQQIIRCEASGDLGINKSVIVAGLPVGQHCGGGIEVGPDGRIYFGGGDLGTRAGTDGDLSTMASKITLRFERARWDPGATFRIGVSSDLVSWTLLDPDDAALRVSLVADTPRFGLDTITIREPEPVGAHARRFMRLEVTRP